ncbi:YxeA family protein [Vagococcus humatus]|uniref:DUF1093 domain-containing protein n=1 Tax=Vagococcus humatus TaxID=1889241 RepID=A0A3S0ACZ9_9ENTE|nr:YxeA family protein [Vagococcus humatus]RST89938.1 hypothetical protein C7P63_02350 [Vagococcus humatus]
MKKWGKRLLMLALILLFLPSVGSFLLKDQTSPTSLAITQHLDRYNLLIREESVYVKIDKNYEAKKEEKGYLYQQLAYKDNGDSYNLAFYTPEKLSAETYLELKVKGSFVINCQEIPQTEVPNQALTALDLTQNPFSDSLDPDIGE